jgi:hypothetical protein
MKKIILLALLLASPLAAQTPQAIQCAKLSPAGAGAYPSPQATYTMGFTSQANNTWVLAVTPAPTLTENGSPWGTNVAPGLFTAPTLGAAESIQIAYNGTEYTDARLCEYPGQLALDVAALILTGTSQVAVSNTLEANAGDIVIAYGWQTTSNLVTETPAAGFALEPGTVGMYMEDETAAAAGSVTGGVQWSGVVNWTSGIVALKQSVQNVTLTFGPAKTINGDVCANMVTFDDGSSIFSGQPAPESVMQLQGNAWVNIGTPVIQPNGQIVGSVSLNPNYTDANGLIELQLLVQTMLNLPPASAVPIAPSTLTNGQTGLCGSFIVYKATLTPKYETFGFTP